MLHYLLPWEFSATWMLSTIAAVAIYLRGMRTTQQGGRRVGLWRPLAFFLGVSAMYGVTQTHFDYLAQYMFFIHRAQHLVLHHAAPFLIALAAPLPMLAAGLPAQLKGLSVWSGVGRILGPLYRLLQHPIVAPVLFVGLIYFWLIPEVHFDAMLSRELYQVMNWSMALDGLLFWWLMLDRRTGEEGGLGYGKRIVVLIATVPPQIGLGAYIAFSDNVLFDIYSVCGRAWPLPPLDDQRLGGLITWIPAAMMSALGTIIVLSYILRGSGDRGENSIATTRKEDAAI